MPYTRVHAIKKTLGKSLDYIKNEEKTTFIGAKDDLADAMKYISNPNKTKNFSFVEGWQCDPTFAEHQFEETREKYLAAHGGKERNTTGSPTLAFHLIQSFPPEMHDAALVHQCGMELAERVGGGQYKAVVATHVEGAHCLHNHIVMCAYPENERGVKYHRSVQEYQRVKELSDSICEQYGIESIITNEEKQRGGRAPSIGELSAKKADNSWKQKIRNDFEKLSDVCDNWDNFKSALIANGYKIEEHDSYVKYQSPYSKRPVRDRTLGELYTRDYLQAQWNPEAKKKYEQKKEQEKKAAAEKLKNESKKYDAEERARWREAERLAAAQSKEHRMKADDPTYKVARFDANGNRRSNVQMLILVAIKVIHTDKDLFEDQAGLQRYPYSPIYAPTDWKLQAMLSASKDATELDIKDVSDIAVKEEQLGKKLATVGTEIRKKKAYLNRVENLYEAIEKWKATKDIIAQLDELPKEEKNALKEAHDAEVKTYNSAMAVFNKFSGKRATTPIMVWDSNKKKRVVSIDNINHVLGNISQTRQELNTLQDQRGGIAKEYAKVRRVSTSLSLAQNELFCHGPQYTPEKLEEIHARAKAEEEKTVSQYEVVQEVSDSQMEEFVDDMLHGERQQFDGFEKRQKNQEQGRER